MRLTREYFRPSFVCYDVKLLFFFCYLNLVLFKLCKKACFVVVFFVEFFVCFFYSFDLANWVTRKEILMTGFLVGNRIPHFFGDGYFKSF